MDFNLCTVALFPSNDLPRHGWARCDGATLPISSNAALFALLSASFGGDGRTTFALPSLPSQGGVHPIICIEGQYQRLQRDDFGDLKMITEIDFNNAGLKMVGFIFPFNGSAVPADWLPCDGRSLKKSDYPELNQVIGNAFGGGTQDANMNLPNLNGDGENYIICCRGAWPY